MRICAYPVTILLTVAGAVAGLALGIVFNRLYHSRLWLLPVMIRFVCEFIRNTPFLIQLFFVFFGLPALGLRLTPLQAAFLATSLNIAAYSAEIVRAGLQITPRGQIEAALSLGMTRAECFWRIMLLPALQRTWPALSSQLVLVMLGSAVVSQISIADLSSAANFIQSRNFRAFETYFVLTLLYMVLSLAYRYLLACIGRFIFPRGAAV